MIKTIKQKDKTDVWSGKTTKEAGRWTTIKLSPAPPTLADLR